MSWKSPANASTPRIPRGWRRWDPRCHLPLRVALAIGAGGLLITLLAGWISSRALHEQIEKQTGAYLENLADQAGDKLDRVLYERYRELQFSARVPALRISATPSDERRRQLESIMETSPDYAWIGLANASGVVTAATGHELEGSGVGEQPWFRTGRSKPYSGDVHEVPGLSEESAGSQGPSRFIDLSVPVLADSGQFLGVLGAHLAWSSLASETLASVLPSTAGRDRIGLTFYSSGNEVLLEAGRSGWSQPFEPPVLPDRRKPRGFFIENTPNGVTFLTGYARSQGYRDFKGFAWLIAVRQPVEITFAPVTLLQRRILQGGLGLTLVAAGLSWFLAAQLTRRLRVIGLAAERIREGDLLTVLPQPRDDGEISALCGSLGSMVDEFRQQQEKLEADNLRLTARLKEQNQQPK